MTDIVAVTSHIPAMDSQAIERVRELEAVAATMPQSPIETQHVLHAGVYSRTILIPKGVLITGVLVRVPTTLILSGKAAVHTGDRSVKFSGYQVLTASANRKQAIYAEEDTYLTMLFKSDAATVKEAEEQFTEEVDLLISRRSDAINHITITGE